MIVTPITFVGMPATKNRYLSILKFKAAELDAVRRLDPGVWNRWNPLFELLPDDYKSAALPLDLLRGEGVTSRRKLD